MSSRPSGEVARKLTCHHAYSTLLKVHAYKDSQKDSEHCVLLDSLSSRKVERSLDKGAC